MYNNNPSTEVAFRAEACNGYKLYFGYIDKNGDAKIVIINYDDGDHFKELIFDSEDEFVQYICEEKEFDEVESIYKWDEGVLGAIPEKFINILEEDEEYDIDGDYPNEIERDGELEIE